MTYQQTRVVAATVQQSPMIGHNRPPELKLFGLFAAWLRYAETKELKRLAKLHVRIERREKALADLRKERTMIMNRCIRRMRRASGKQ